ncbi:MAG: MaoC family dehydratase [Actinomycetota bacterium]|jgi:acyl dehydratase
MTELVPTTLPPITREQVQHYAEAVGDFNAIHFDTDFARAAGLPDTVVHGPLTVAKIADVLAAQLGVDALLNLDVRLRAPVFPGEELAVEGTDYGVKVVKADGTVAATAVVIIRDDESADKPAP